MPNANDFRVANPFCRVTGINISKNTIEINLTNSVSFGRNSGQN